MVRYSYLIILTSAFLFCASFFTCAAEYKLVQGYGYVEENVANQGWKTLYTNSTSSPIVFKKSGINTSVYSWRGSGVYEFASQGPSNARFFSVPGLSSSDRGRVYLSVNALPFYIVEGYRVEEDGSVTLTRSELDELNQDGRLILGAVCGAPGRQMEATSDKDKEQTEYKLTVTGKDKNGNPVQFRTRCVYEWARLSNQPFIYIEPSTVSVESTSLKPVEGDFHVMISDRYGSGLPGSIYWERVSPSPCRAQMRLWNRYGDWGSGVVRSTSTDNDIHMFFRFTPSGPEVCTESIKFTFTLS